MVTKAALAAVAASVLLLTGCVTVNPPPKPGLSDSEIKSFVRLQRDLIWSSIADPRGEKPSVRDIQIVQPRDFGDAYAKCMNDAGYFNYFGAGDQYTVQSAGLLSDAEMSETLECSARVQVDPAEFMLNRAQGDYLYDYFQDSLIPCLELAGYRITDVPPRSQLAYGGWNPYYIVQAESGFDPESPIVQRCPPVPSGLAFGRVKF